DIARLCETARHDAFDRPAGKVLKALVLPHAGYIYSGPTAAHAALVLEKGQFDKVILLGPDHRAGLNNGAITDAAGYRTPLGDIPL
ncbi:MAG: AmmeMemoRadiSam system protein B, partial [Desulfuromonadaceae bacterium GWB2_53_15]